MRNIFFFLLLLALYSCGDLSESNEVDDETDIGAKMYELKKYASDSANLDTHTGFSGNGISVNQLTESIMNKYDQDHDRILDVNLDSFLRKRVGYEPGDTVIYIKTESRGLLFTNADKEGDRNGLVTEKELMQHLDQFDENHDGEITTGNAFWDSIFGEDTEWDKLEAKYEERYSYKSERVSK